MDAASSALDAIVQRLTRGSVHPSEPDAARESEHELLRDAGSAIRVLRNACAAGADSQAFVVRHGVPVMTRLLAWLARQGEGGPGWEASVSLTRRLSWQCFANVIAGNSASQAQWWQVVVVERADEAVEHALVAARGDPALAGVVIHTIYNCVVDPAGDSAAMRAAAMARLAELVASRSLLCSLLALAQGGPAVAESAGLLVLRCVEAGTLGGLMAAAAVGTSIWRLSPPPPADPRSAPARAESEEATPVEAAFAESAAAAGVSTALDTRSGGGAALRPSAAFKLPPPPSSMTAELVVLLHLLESCDAAKWLAAVAADGGSAGAEAPPPRAPASISADAASADFRALVALLASLCDSACDAGKAAAALDSRAQLALPVLLTATSVLADSVADGVADSLPVAASWHVGPAADSRAAVVAALPLLLALLHELTPLPAPSSLLPVGAAAPTPGASDGAALPESGGGSDEGPPMTRVALVPAIPRASCPAGLRSALCRLVALAVYRDAGAAAAVLHAGGGTGVRVVLSQCAIDAANPTLREWGLLSVRNLCEALPGPGGVPGEIEKLKAAGVAAAPELGALGVPATAAAAGT